MNGDMGMPSSAMALSATSKGVPSSTADMTSPKVRVTRRLKTKAGLVAAEDGGLLQRLRGGESRCESGIIGLAALDDLEEGKNGHRV